MRYSFISLCSKVKVSLLVGWQNELKYYTISFADLRNIILLKYRLYMWVVLGSSPGKEYVEKFGFAIVFNVRTYLEDFPAYGEIKSQTITLCEIKNIHI